MAISQNIVTMAMFLLFEAASGYGLLECIEAEEVASQSKKVLESVGDVSKFSKIVKLNAFQAFESAEDALQNINDVSEGASRGCPVQRNWDSSAAAAVSARNPSRRYRQRVSQELFGDELAQGQGWQEG